jgi:hypothetical protein
MGVVPSLSMLPQQMQDLPQRVNSLLEKCRKKLAISKQGADRAQEYADEAQASLMMMGQVEQKKKRERRKYSEFGWSRNASRKSKRKAVEA